MILARGLGLPCNVPGRERTARRPRFFAPHNCVSGQQFLQTATVLIDVLHSVLLLSEQPHASKERARVAREVFRRARAPVEMPRVQHQPAVRATGRRHDPRGAGDVTRPPRAAELEVDTQPVVGGAVTAGGERFREERLTGLGSRGDQEIHPLCAAGPSQLEDEVLGRLAPTSQVTFQVKRGDEVLALPIVIPAEEKKP